MERMTDTDEIQYRHEDKYLMSQRQSVIIHTRLKGILKTDAHAHGGIYNVRSLYFDDIDNSCYYANENGILPREKFRIRIYNGDSSYISLELKCKDKGMTYKKSCLIDKSTVQKILDGGIPYTDNNSNPLLVKLASEMKTKMLRPKIIVSYDREPFVYKTGNVRITIDRNISSSDYISEFLNESIPLRPVIPHGYCILESKWDSILPAFIRETISMPDLTYTGFSKYYYCRKYSFIGGKNL